MRKCVSFVFLSARATALTPPELGKSRQHDSSYVHFCLTLSAPSFTGSGPQVQTLSYDIDNRRSLPTALNIQTRTAPSFRPPKMPLPTSFPLKVTTLVCLHKV